MQIENKNYLSKIEERNQELSTLKLSTGKTVQILNEFKRKLSDKLEEAEWLKAEVTRSYLEMKQYPCYQIYLYLYGNICEMNKSGGQERGGEGVIKCIP